MAEKKAPPIPHIPKEFMNADGTVAPVTSGAVEQAGEPQYGLYDDNFAADLNLPARLLTTKSMAIILICMFIVGLFFGGIFFGGKKQVVEGLGGIVGNPDVVAGTPRCGMISPGQECVIYMMNSTRIDRYAETFFDEAVRLTEVAKYSIAMANPQYAKKVIKPGYIAQIKIPNVR